MRELPLVGLRRKVVAASSTVGNKSDFGRQKKARKTVLDEFLNMEVLPSVLDRAPFT